MRPIALSLGDPAGIGPEIAVAAWVRLGGSLPLVVVGDRAALAGPAAAAGIALAPIRDPAAGLPADGLPVLQMDTPAPVRPGHPDPAHAPAVIAWIRRATELVRTGAASALVTNPVSKAVLKRGADFPYPGHTEFLAHLSGAARAVMMLTGPGIRVVPATIHIPLSAVPAALTPDLLDQTIGITHDALRRDFGIARPRLAITGLNPHAGEDGTMGTEEAAVIAPAVARARAAGIAATGPHPADTLFHERARAGWDAAIAMYHDQALIPVKTLAFDRAANVTLGLDFVRTSPDHGTAFDIAGQGRADPASLLAAIRLAGDMARARHAGT